MMYLPEPVYALYACAILCHSFWSLDSFLLSSLKNSNSAVDKALPRRVCTCPHPPAPCSKQQEATLSIGTKWIHMEPIFTPRSHKISAWKYFCKRFELHFECIPLARRTKRGASAASAILGVAAENLRHAKMHRRSSRSFERKLMQLCLVQLSSTF